MDRLMDDPRPPDDDLSQKEAEENIMLAHGARIMEIGFGERRE